MKGFYKHILNKDNQYFKLYQLLFDHNQKYRRNQMNEEKSMGENYSEKYFNKPIIIEHFIKEDTSFSNNSKISDLNSKFKDEFRNNSNCELNYSIKNDDKINNAHLDGNNNKINISKELNYSTLKSKNQSSTIKNRYSFSRIINIKKKNKGKSIHSSLYFDDHKRIL